MEWDVQTIIQGGAVGISILLIGLIAFILRSVYRLVTNHMDHTNRTTQENARAMANMANALAMNTKAIDNNTRVMERVERVLDRGGR